MSDWSLPREALSYVRRLPPGATVLELGSGEGTARLVDIVGAGNVYTVEHDEKYLGLARGAHYIHAPIVGHQGPRHAGGGRWYDAAAIERALPRRIDCVIVDGPPGDIGRAGLLSHLDMFGDAPVIVDDVHRTAERDLLLALSRARGKAPFSIHCLSDGRAFATLGWGDL